jgi:preprotein translocase subunit SecY
MKLESLDRITRLVPSIKGPRKPLSTREKIYWTAGILAIYIVLFNVPVFGVASQNNSPFFLLDIIFAEHTSIIIIGISSLLGSVVIIQMLIACRFLKVDISDAIQKSRLQKFQKFIAIILVVTFALSESWYLWRVGAISSTFSPQAFPSFNSSLINGTYPENGLGALYIFVVAQLIVGGLIVILLDEVMRKYGITSGVNAFIVTNFAIAIVGSSALVMAPEAMRSVLQAPNLWLSDILISFAPLLATALAIVIGLLFIINIHAKRSKSKLIFERLRHAGSLPIPYMYDVIWPALIVFTFIFSITTLLMPFTAYGHPSNASRFLAYYVNESYGAGQSPELIGGIMYLMGSYLPLPYSTAYGGVGTYETYLYIITTAKSYLYLPWGGKPLLIPGWVHEITYVSVFTLLSAVFSVLWFDLTRKVKISGSEAAIDAEDSIAKDRRLALKSGALVGLLVSTDIILGSIDSATTLILSVGIAYTIYRQLSGKDSADDKETL